MTYYANIKAYAAHVTPADIAAGEAAYPAYFEMMRRVSERYSLNQTRVTEAFAALSPNNDYFGNLRSLVSVIEGVQYDRDYTISTYKACGRRAATYLTGEVDFLSTVKGKKITAFRNCIVDPHTCEDFVLDGHMIAVALGKRLTMSEANLALRDHRYDMLAKAYRLFARKRGLRVPVLQATLWHCRKRTEAIKFTTQRDFWRDDARLLYPVDEVLPYVTKPKDDPNAKPYSNDRHAGQHRHHTLDSTQN